MIKAGIGIAGATLLLALPLTSLAVPTVYIPLGSGNQVIAVDAASDSITATYLGVDNPHGLVATPDGEYLVVGSLKETPAQDPKATTSKLFIIHPVHGHVMQTVPVVGWTHHQAVTPNGRHVISTHPTRNGISVLDMQTNAIARTVATGPAPNYALVTRDGRRAFVSNSGNGTISEIDLADFRVTRTLDAGPSPEHMVFAPDEQTVYVTNPRAGSVSAVSRASGKVGRTYHVGHDVHGLDLSDDGKTLYASSRQEEKLVAIDIASGKQRALRLSPAPYHLNAIRGAGKVYVSSSKAPTIWVIDQATFRVSGQIALPKGEGHQMAVVP